MNPNPLSDQLEQLLKDKDVHALTQDEQQLVIQELGSLEAYTRLRTVVARSQDVFIRESIAPSSAVLGHIMARVDKEQTRLPKKKNIYQLPVPLYQTAATVLLAIGLTWWWASSKTAYSQDPVVITLVDTVYQDIVRVDTIRMETPSAPSSFVQSTRPRKKDRVQTTTLASHEIPPPDYRFSRGDYPIASARRAGQSQREQAIPISLDSMPGMDRLFAADQVF